MRRHFNAPGQKGPQFQELGIISCGILRTFIEPGIRPARSAGFSPSHKQSAQGEAIAPHYSGPWDQSRAFLVTRYIRPKRTARNRGRIWKRLRQMENSTSDIGEVTNGPRVSSSRSPDKPRSLQTPTPHTRTNSFSVILYIAKNKTQSVGISLDRNVFRNVGEPITACFLNHFLTARANDLLVRAADFAVDAANLASDSVVFKEGPAKSLRGPLKVVVAFGFMVSLFRRCPRYLEQGTPGYAGRVG